MRILFLTHGFNSLTQRLYAELTARGHEVSVEFDIADSVSEEAVALWRPDLILAPFLKRAIPESIWKHHLCWVVHPGIVGDRGPSALDWAIQEGANVWGVTVLQAEAEMDAGPIWATQNFPLRRARKASVYRQEATEAALAAVLSALERLERGEKPTPLSEWPNARGQLRPSMKQVDRAIAWQKDDTQTVLGKIDAADGFPGVADSLFDQPCHLYDAWPEERLRGEPGAVIARRATALCRATVDGALWIGHVKRAGGIKLPATIAYAKESAGVPEVPLDGWWASEHATWQDIRYEEDGAIGWLHFDFYNGAMGTEQCQRLLDAFLWATQRPTRVIVLMGGRDFWSNGIHLNLIENAPSPADESWANINAIDDLAEAIIRCESHLTVAALGGNAGAGGCFLARACDEVWVKDGVVLNPHYKNMGNLFGSEFWTYSLPPRVGAEGAAMIMHHRLPMLAREAVQCGFYDAVLPAPTFRVDIARRAQELAAAWAQRRADKRAQRAADEAQKPLATYRAEELAQMRRNFYGFDPSYHVARWHFVSKTPHSWTPRHLARHRM
ncbi:hydrogenase maturation protein [Sulfuricystis multivorans]|uniref:hydrogenase maturation protein n=1 Tax=Sulfuricystis multivorans TaxID=2211108 RepID=UPI000F84BCBC|nr:hydrogenase maturation protein [Sulfuricystis multivorans]